LLATIQVNQAPPPIATAAPASASSHLTIAGEIESSQAALRNIVASLHTTTTTANTRTDVTVPQQSTIVVGQSGAALPVVQAAYAEHSKAA
jgi:hypothetical protein